MNKLKTVRNFWNDEQGQDLIEYTLLMAFVALASAALFIGAGGSVKGIWSTTKSQLTAANTSARYADGGGFAPPSLGKIDLLPRLKISPDQPNHNQTKFAGV